MRLGLSMLFQVMISFGVTPYFLAMLNSVSPCDILWIIGLVLGGGVIFLGLDVGISSFCWGVGWEVMFFSSVGFGSLGSFASCVGRGGVGFSGWGSEVVCGMVFWAFEGCSMGEV